MKTDNHFEEYEEHLLSTIEKMNRIYDNHLDKNTIKPTELENYNLNKEEINFLIFYIMYVKQLTSILRSKKNNLIYILYTIIFILLLVIIFLFK